MKKIIQWKLAILSRAILKKYHPKVIGITGSIGKTSAKEAVFAVVSSKFKARTNIKNYNNEFGLPLTIINKPSPRKNIFGWLGVLWKALCLVIYKQDYPEILVLEMGIDKPGDMDELVSIVHPDTAILTTVGISHLEFFGTREVVLSEKSKIFSKMNSGNTAILNFDDDKVKNLKNILPTKIISYGRDAESMVHIKNYASKFSEENQVYGTEVEIEYNGQNEKVFLKNVLGFPPVSAAAAATAAGISLGMTIDEIKIGLENSKPEPGRMRLVEGINNTLMIEDTYNAAPLSTIEALKTLKDFTTNKFEIKKRIAILGSMVELGSESDKSHQEVAQKARECADIFVGVGEEMKNVNPDFWFPDSKSAISKAEELAEPGTLFLVKGSQARRMEKISYALLKDKDRAKELIPRQDDYWLKK